MLDAQKEGLIKQAETIKKIALDNNAVIVGRSADYILKDNPKLIKIFLYAPLDYRINTVRKLYKDSFKDAKKHVLESDRAKSTYYELTTNQVWGKKENYDLCINCEKGNEKIVKLICDYIKHKRKKF